EDAIAYTARTGAASFSCGYSNNRDVANCLEAKSPKKTFVGTATLVSLNTKSLADNYEMVLKIYGSPPITIGKKATLQIDNKNQLHLVGDDNKAWKADVVRKAVVETRSASRSPLVSAGQVSAPPYSGIGRELSLTELEGSIIVAEDGQPLGLITTNCFDADA